MTQTLYNDDYRKMIKKLKQARLKAGLTQVEVAKLLNKPQSYVAKIENCQRRLDISELKLFSVIYRKNASAFL